MIQPLFYTLGEAEHAGRTRAPGSLAGAVTEPRQARPLGLEELPAARREVLGYRTLSFINLQGKILVYKRVRALAK